MKKLRYVCKKTKYTLFGNKNLLSEDICDLCYRSAEARKNTIFFCLKGAHTDGHNFAAEAYKNGARIFVCEHILPLPQDVLQIIAKNSRFALAEFSAEFFDHPERKLKLIGITGTKGKSSVCEMIFHILTQSGKKAASIGTLGIKIGDYTKETQNSTPESYVLYKAFAKMLSLGVEYVAMEVSSQAAMQHRVHGLHFIAAVFTNLSRDHIGDGEHPNFEHYKACKKAIFKSADMAFINADSPFATEFAKVACRVQTYGTENADFTAKNINNFCSKNFFGVSFLCRAKNGDFYVNLPIPGDFSVCNALAAISVCRHLGIETEACSSALATVHVRGRFELVETKRRDITCIIDYAHNGESLRTVLGTLREYARRRIICVFGSVGGRTQMRRRELALAADELADICIVTSDNPDFEPPEEIIGEIAEYISPKKCFCITDRAQAVRCALEMAERGDFLLFAGKGHEEYQLICGKKLPFSERELIKKYAEYSFLGLNQI
ncbi:MAG: UDP-N-acetylmuramoyl-L-alanyl-D-glutamate--2,6-diaminopimelate ligase [Clostridia bacterium]|nr:UDP-N-acetylmuramoyl-L-alanyl-D-glutamate--2,6-diaminopimelate ligase [Clostridia bacterium]